MGCNDSKPITPFIYKEWINPFDVIYLDDSQYDTKILNQCKDNIDEIQESFDYAKRLIDDEKLNECNRKNLKKIMINYKIEADNYVNFILKDKIGRLSKGKCKNLNKINKEISYTITDWLKNNP